MKIAVYPGTFDPITNGHLDILKKALKMFDKVILAVACDNGKNNLFTAEEREQICKEVVKDMENVEVEKYAGLSVDFANKKGAKFLVRGLRAISDFEYELQIALTNKKIAGDLETVFFLPNLGFLYLSSTIIRQVCSLGGDLTEFIPKEVEIALKKKFAGD